VPKYLFTARYSVEGIRALSSKGGRVRKAAVQSAVKGLGGKMESFYFAFGADDAYVVVDLPTNEAAAALALAVGSAGAATVRTTLLLSPSEMDAAADTKVSYRPPGS
jgi:uncharacterized protein with GYD domain